MRSVRQPTLAHTAFRWAARSVHTTCSCTESALAHVTEDPMQRMSEAHDHALRCSCCGAVGHAAHACTVIHTDSGLTRLGTTLDWEVCASMSIETRLLSQRLTSRCKTGSPVLAVRAPCRGLLQAVLLPHRRVFEVLSSLLTRAHHRGPSKRRCLIISR